MQGRERAKIIINCDLTIKIYWDLPIKINLNFSSIEIHYQNFTFISQSNKKSYLVKASMAK